MRLSDVYANRPTRFFAQILSNNTGIPNRQAYCAGFEVEEWRCTALADHLIEWLADYALKEDELRVHHGNMYIRLREAAIRIYTSNKYKKRGEIGEIALHAICREFFGTIPFAPRVFYLTSSNDVVKSFDLAHVRTTEGKCELWLGEAKFYEDAAAATKAAIASIAEHIELGFLRSQKLILGPQVSKSLPNYQEIRDLLSTQTSLDELFHRAVFPVLIAGESTAAKKTKRIDDNYKAAVDAELATLSDLISASGLTRKIKIILIYLPLAAKPRLADEFDKRLKGLQP